MENGEIDISPLINRQESSLVPVIRSGTLWTAVAHIITAVIGSGVLSLSWSVAQLGWVAGPIILIFFAVVTAVQSSLMADCYLSPDPENGPIRNRSYIDAVRRNLGEKSGLFCGFFQLINLFGYGIAYTITSVISLRAIKKSDCYHKEGHDAPCEFGDNSFMIIFGVVQVIISQIPDFHDMAWLSVLAAIMSFSYSFIGLGLGLANVIANGTIKGGIGGVPMNTPAQKVWRVSQALGDIAFAFPYSIILLEIQVYTQPVFSFVDTWFAERFPNSEFVNYPIKMPFLPPYKLNLLRLFFRSFYVATTTGLAMLFPYFNQVLGLLGALNFWPLAIYFPVEMYFIQRRINPWSTEWIVLQGFSLVCLFISIFSLVGSFEGVLSEKLG